MLGNIHNSTESRHYDCSHQQSKVRKQQFSHTGKHKTLKKKIPSSRSQTTFCLDATQQMAKRQETLMSGNLNKEGFLMRGIVTRPHVKLCQKCRASVSFFFAFALSNIHNVRNPSISTKDLMVSAFFPCTEESTSSRSKYCPLLPYLLVKSSSESCLLISIHFHLFALRILLHPIPVSSDPHGPLHCSPS